MFTGLASTEMDRAEQAADLHSASNAAASTAASSASTSSLGEAGTRLPVGSGFSWTSSQHHLQRGVNGPRVPSEIIDLANSALADILEATKFTHASQCSFDEKDLHKGTSERRVLKPGHCVELDAGGLYAQVLLVDVAAERTADGPPPGQAQLLVHKFQKHDQTHPELPVPWLRRHPKGFDVIPVSRIYRRAHIIPIFRGGDSDAACEPNPREFLVNTLAHPLYAGVPGRKIFLTCPHCNEGRLLKPANLGDLVQCEKCGVQSPWL